MTPAEIAAKLTPGQVRALRDPRGCSRKDFGELACAALEIAPQRFFEAQAPFTPPFTYTPLGRAVLAALDAKGEPK